MTPICAAFLLASFLYQGVSLLCQAYMLLHAKNSMCSKHSQVNLCSAGMYIKNSCFRYNPITSVTAANHSEHTVKVLLQLASRICLGMHWTWLQVLSYMLTDIILGFSVTTLLYRKSGIRDTILLFTGKHSQWEWTNANCTYITNGKLTSNQLLKLIKSIYLKHARMKSSHLFSVWNRNRACQGRV